MEKVFYEKSSWEPLRACKEIEDLIKNLQDKFDKWTPPKYIKDNLSKEERNLIKQLKENDNIVYKCENDQRTIFKFKTNLYKQVQDDPSEPIKQKSDAIVHDMFVNDAISESV